MKNQIKFYFDFISPYSYLAYTQLESFSKRNASQFEYIPIDVISLMSAVGNSPTSATCELKSIYAISDLGRWAVRYQTKIAPHPLFGKVSTTQLLLGALSAASAHKMAEYVRAAFSAIWVEHQDIEDDASIIRWLSESGVEDSKEIWTQRHQFEANLNANQTAAIEDGVFGVPSFKTNQDLYFGNDRLEFLEEDLVR